MWQSIKDIQNPIPVRELKGVNKLEPFSISDGHATFLKNLTSSGSPSLTVRPGS